LKILLDRGVQHIGDPKQCHAIALDARSPKFDGGIITRLDSIVFGVVVNKNAERFYDEGEDLWPKRYAIWGRLIAAQRRKCVAAGLRAPRFELVVHLGVVEMDDHDPSCRRHDDVLPAGAAG